jgi:hypothetical protein
LESLAPVSVGDVIADKSRIDRILGVGGMMVVQGSTSGAGIGLLGPAPVGILLSAVGWAVVMMFPRARTRQAPN